MNPKSFLVLSALVAGLLPGFVGAASFRAPGIPAPVIASIDSPLPKSAAPAVDESGRLRVGEVRALPKAASVPAFTPLARGWVTRFTVSAPGAAGLRVRLDLGALPGAMEVRVQGSDVVEQAVIDPRLGPDAWTPWTEGDTQVVEIASDVEPAGEAVRVGAVLQFTTAPTAKAAASCTIPTPCTTGDTTLDAAVANAKKGVMRLQFVEGSSGFVCTGTLIDTEKRPAPYVATAYHCIHDADTARTVTSLWFYENSTCEASSPLSVNRQQVSGGASMVFANHNVDSSLILMNASAPSGAAYIPVNAARLASGDRIVSLSHPAGDALRLAQGTVHTEYRIEGAPQDFYGVEFQRGIIEGGSSGSGLFTLTNGTLQIRGLLSGSTLFNGSGMSCSNTAEEGLYSRLDVFAPQFLPFVKAAGVPADDAPNRPQDLFAASAGAAIDTRAGGLIALDNLRIDYAGDMDVVPFDLAQPAVVSAWSEGANLDTVGAILDARGAWIASNDDASTASTHFGVTAALQPGRYYVQVGHFDADGTGAYNLRIRADRVDATNYTDLWGNSSESGWGANINHQGNTIFVSLFTYDGNGAPMWLVMTNGDKQLDGSFSGPLFRGTGPAFNAQPFTGAKLAEVGTMRVQFTSDTSAVLTYTYQGVPVTKAISRFVFAKANTCSWSAFDRSFTFNFQDLWLSPAEPGWGVNIAHQGKTLFASLFTYDAGGRDLWLYMSQGDETSPGKYAGQLYRNNGPRFDTQPWTGSTATPAGTMGFNFSDGNHGTLTYTYDGITVTKQIQRYAFGAVKPACD